MIVLGIDAGATKTVCLLADEKGNILQRSYGPGANLQISGEGDVEAVLKGVIDEVLFDRGLADALCIGMAGADRPRDSKAVHAILERIGRSRRNRVTNDAVIALVAGAGEPYGVVLLVGTGSTAYGMSRSGKVARSGGWGYLIGDEGSAYWMGIRALRAVVRAADGRARETLLTTRVLESFGLESVGSLIHQVYQRPSRVQIAGLARTVQEAAVLGDEAAQEITHDAGREIIRAADSVIGQLDIVAESFPFVLSGGLWKAVPIVRHEVSNFLPKIAPRAEVVELQVDPAVGAVQLAIESPGE